MAMLNNHVNSRVVHDPWRMLVHRVNFSTRSSSDCDACALPEKKQHEFMVHGCHFQRKRHYTSNYLIILQYHIIIILSHVISSYIISYHILLYHQISYVISSYIIVYHNRSYHIILYPFISNHIVLYHIKSNHIILYHII